MMLHCDPDGLKLLIEEFLLSRTAQELIAINNEVVSISGPYTYHSLFLEYIDSENLSNEEMEDIAQVIDKSSLFSFYFENWNCSFKIFDPMYREWYKKNKEN